ncbi:MAG: SET domain-containing protein [Candidatus Saccharibacteria bacterium]
MNETSDMSFRVRPSTLPGGGAGVFALHDIASDVWLALKPKERVGIDRNKEDIPEDLLDYCIENADGTYNGPPEFNHMHIVWYLNHSDEPNAEQRSDGYYSVRDIKKGEEIFIDYNLFHEPSLGKVVYDEAGNLKAEV